MAVGVVIGAIGVVLGYTICNYVINPLMSKVKAKREQSKSKGKKDSDVDDEQSDDADN